MEGIERAVRLWGRTACSFDVLDATARYAFFASQRVSGALVPYKVVGRADAVIGSWDLGIRDQPVWKWLSGFRLARFFTSVQ